MPHVNRSKRQSPTGPHRFVAPDDPRLGLALAGGGGTTGSWVPGALPVVAASLREPHCALPGCGKTRDDPIHMPPD